MGILEESKNTEGYSITFEDGENIIKFKCTLNGLEEVFVNNELVASQKNLLSKNSELNFTVQEIEYAINIEVHSLLTGTTTCTLLKNGIPYKRKKVLFYVSIPKDEKIKFHFRISTIIYLSALLFIIKIGWDVPIIYLLGIASLILIPTYFYKNKNHKMLTDPIIEEIKL